MSTNFQECGDFKVFKQGLNIKSQLFLVLHVNIRSIRKYWSLFNLLVKDVTANTDIFVLTETNVSEDWWDLFKLAGYNSFWFSRSNVGGGGIAVFIKNKWLVSKLDISFSHAETIALKIENSNFIIFILACYRPPSQSVRSFLEELKKTLNEMHNRGLFCLVGDINIDVAKQERSDVCDYLNILANEGIESTIKAPTREEIISGKLVTSCIDHICVRAENTVTMSSVITEKMADHYFVGCQFVNSGETKPEAETKQIEIIDNVKLDRLISTFDWISFRKSTSQSDLYTKFTQIINSFTEKCKRTVRIKKRRPDHAWLNTEVLTAIKAKELAWARSRRAPENNKLRSEFRIARNRANAMLRLAKRKHFKNKFEKARFSSSETWSLVNTVRGHQRKPSVDDVVKKHFGNKLRDIVERFNSYFVRSTSAPERVGISEAVIEMNATSAFLYPMSLDDLRSILFSIKPTRSPGVDGITLGCLQRNFRYLQDTLLFMLNGFIELGVIPNELKTAIVRPIFKGGDPKKVENYRPISILPVLEHVFEKHIFHIMTSFIDQCSLFSSRQYGFISGSGTQLLLEDVADKIYSGFEGNMFSCAVFLDVSKAFDTVNHEILLEKLWRFGFRGPFHSLLKNLLEGRAQVVSIDKVNSSTQLLETGVPQGSVLSPLLFNVYVNDLETVISGCDIFQYADDTLLVSRHINFEKAVHALQLNVLKVMDWYAANRIRVNPLKTKLVCFRNPLKPGFSNAPFLLHSSGCKLCCCKPVPWVDYTRYMGLIFEYDMSWNKQMAHLCCVLRRVACMLYNMRLFVPFKVRKTIVHALAYSVLRYGVTLHAYCTTSWHSKIDSILKGILRSVAYNSCFSSSEDFFRDLQMPRLRSLYTETVVLRHFWSESFKTVHTPSRLLRTSPRYEVQRCVTRYGKRMRSFYVSDIFNTLPEDIFSVTGKGELKKWLRHYACES